MKFCVLIFCAIGGERHVVGRAVAAGRVQPVEELRRDRDEAGLGVAPHRVADLRVDAPDVLGDDHARRQPGDAARRGRVGADRAAGAGREPRARHGDGRVVLGDDRRVRLAEALGLRARRPGVGDEEGRARAQRRRSRAARPRARWRRAGRSARAPSAVQVPASDRRRAGRRSTRARPRCSCPRAAGRPSRAPACARNRPG